MFSAEYEAVRSHIWNQVYFLLMPEEQRSLSARSLKACRSTQLHLDGPAKIIEIKSHIQLKMHPLLHLHLLKLHLNLHPELQKDVTAG